MEKKFTVEGFSAQLNLIGTDEANSLSDNPHEASVIEVTKPAAATRSFTMPRTTEEACREINKLKGKSLLAIDTETTGLDPLKDRIRLVQIGAPGEPPLLLDMFALEREKTISALNELLEDIGKTKLFHNAKFDLSFLKVAGVNVEGPIFDTMLAEQLIISGLGNSSVKLSDLSLKYLHRPLSKEQQTSDWSGELSKGQLEYAARDVTVLLELYTPITQGIKKAKLSEVAQIEFETLPAVVALELNGILLDRQKLEKLTGQLHTELEEAEANCRNLFGDGINLNSPKQLLEALEKRGIKTDKTDAATLKSMEKKHPEASVILRYRKASKAVSTFTEKLPGFIHPVTGRIHPSYWQLGAATGRFSCSNPNLQQIPNELRFRECFIPAPGNKFVIADYSQIELRVAAAISRDPVMLKAYRTGEDLHRQTAAILTGKDPADIDKKERQLAKAVNFGLLFAMGARGLSDYAENSYGVKMSVREAEEFKGKFFDHYTGLRDWHKCTKSGSYYEARTLKGRRRLWSTVSSLNERLNMPVQGTAADIMKIALARLPKALQGTEAKLVAIIHDEIILEVPEDKAEEAKRMLVTVMESAGDGFIDIPLVAEAAIADSWAGKA
ncbi:bifunctional 3'-5' exonuclease/DNA polymerase [Acetomicrobium sp.]|uniref:bifunctional 3'-5' exonuclease/DNA polymerase n=2 Tax=Thermotogati TaxID=3384194 RepID=UPI001BCBCE7B|nr:bifunctional 3'-5' exonuclease/DNA polymerase [Acetomicrobium sp.]